MGIGMAIPIGMAQSVFEQIVKTGTVTRGFLGVELQELNPELAERFGLEEAMGALVTNVVPDTAADKAGLQQGDIILEVNGEDIEDREDLRNQIGLMKPGTEIEITIWRDMEKRDYTVELGTRDGIGQLSQKTSDIMKELGMSVTELNSEIAQKYGYEDTQGVVISSVEYNSPAAQAGLQPGVKIAEVDRQQVNTLKDFDSMMQQAIDEGGALLLVQQGQYSRYVYLQIPKN